MSELQSTSDRPRRNSVMPPLDTAKLRDLAISDSGFVFDGRTGRTFTVNKTGMVILRALAEGLSQDDIGRRINEKFDVHGDDHLSSDVEDFIGQLQQQGVGT